MLIGVIATLMLVILIDMTAIMGELNKTAKRTDGASAIPTPDQAHPVSSANSHSAVVAALKGMLEPSAGNERPVLRDLAIELGVNPGYLSQVIRGKRKPSLSIYRALRMPPPARMVAVAEGFDVAPVCAKCGVVHVTKRCTAGRATKRRTIRPFG